MLSKYLSQFIYCMSHINEDAVLCDIILIEKKKHKKKTKKKIKYIIIICSYLFGWISFLQVHGEVYSIQQYVITFVSDLRQVGGFLRVLRFLHQ
jgi:hypothetical protein